VDGSLTAASKELSAVPSRAIVHLITTECQELLDLVLELDLPYDAHPIFSTTDSVEEALSQASKPFLAPRKLAVLCVDFSDSGWLFRYWISASIHMHFQPMPHESASSSMG
jgi:hypothetical protein